MKTLTYLPGPVTIVKFIKSTVYAGYFICNEKYNDFEEKVCDQKTSYTDSHQWTVTIIL